MKKKRRKRIPSGGGRPRKAKRGTRTNPKAEAAHELQFEILPQPDGTTCGPACLHAVYRYFRQPMRLEEVIRETEALEGGGTLAVLLACHALSRGFEATIHSYNLKIFDPTWFGLDRAGLAEKIEEQARAKDDPKLKTASQAFLEFLERGGRLEFEDLSVGLLRRHLKRGSPIITGLSATYLYQEERELEDTTPDDIRGEPTGHFVVLHGYDSKTRGVSIADPYSPNPFGEAHKYEVGLERVLCSILLGTLTFDGNLLVLRRGK